MGDCEGACMVYIWTSRDVADEWQIFNNAKPHQLRGVAMSKRDNKLIDADAAAKQMPKRVNITWSNF